MTTEIIKEFFTAHQPTATIDETGEWLNITIDPATLKSIARLLRNPPHNFDFLFCETCIDWKTNLTMVYHLTSTIHRMPVVLKAVLDRTNPFIDTVCDIWRTAEMLEREVYELFGVNFTGHPDLRRLILTDDFEGFPLRKDFEDPINMIKL